jgi:hypothetical protein
MSDYVGPVYLNGGYGSPLRSVGAIIADVTVRESGIDRLTITQHPVEYGASITDHAFKEPCELTIQVGFSDSGNYDGYASDAYAEFLALQQTLYPVDVYTGKRFYPNMMPTVLATETDETSEHVLNLTVSMKEIIFVVLSTSTLPPSSDQASPQDTASPANAGQQQLQPTTSQDNSLLNQGMTNLGLGGGN